MNIHEYQAKAVLRAFAAPVSNGQAAFTPDEAEAAARELAQHRFGLIFVNVHGKQLARKRGASSARGARAPDRPRGKNFTPTPG